MTSVNIIVAGMIGLAGSLLAAHAAPTIPAIIMQWAGGWLGSFLVIVGTGKLLFLESE